MITRAQIRRQLRKNGGIINAVPRQNYGWGSKIKDRFRKLIPNELANVATKAAPFVAPFNPGVAGLMRGIGRFDQRGSISDALKQGLLTYGGGQAARYLGGAGFQGGFGTPGDRFTSPLSSGRTQNFRDFFKGKDVSKVKPVDQGEKGIGIVKKGVEATIGKVPILKELPPMVQQQLFVGGITADSSALHSYLTENFREKLPEETMEQYLEARKKRVGTQMRSYMDNYFTFDPEYSALDDAGKDAFVARYNMKKGGRVGYQWGGPGGKSPGTPIDYQPKSKPIKSPIISFLDEEDVSGIGEADIVKPEEFIKLPEKLQEKKEADLAAQEEELALNEFGQRRNAGTPLIFFYLDIKPVFEMLSLKYPFPLIFRFLF